MTKRMSFKVDTRHQSATGHWLKDWASSKSKPLLYRQTNSFSASHEWRRAILHFYSPGVATVNTSNQEEPKPAAAARSRAVAVHICIPLTKTDCRGLPRPACNVYKHYMALPGSLLLWRPYVPGREARCVNKPWSRPREGRSTTEVTCNQLITLAAWSYLETRLFLVFLFSRDVAYSTSPSNSLSLGQFSTLRKSNFIPEMEFQLPFNVFYPLMKNPVFLYFVSQKCVETMWPEQWDKCHKSQFNRDFTTFYTTYDIVHTCVTVIAALHRMNGSRSNATSS